MTSHRSIAIVALLALAACARPQFTATTVHPECVALPGPDDGADTVRVALHGSVGPAFAPWPRNHAEAFLFYQFYETLITVDCEGRVAPALARSWRRVDGGRHWIFKLREDARFWDGTPVTAGDVVWSWELARFDPATLNAAVDSTSVGESGDLHVYFHFPQRSVPHLLASLAFAVARPSAEVNWLAGSGVYRMEVVAQRRSWGYERSILGVPAWGGGYPVLDFIETTARDPRDLLESGVDLVITSDPAVVEYASAREQFAPVPLAWDRTYLFISPARVQILSTGGNPGAIPPDLLDELARDAVRADARGFRKPSWWSRFRVCDDEARYSGPFGPAPDDARRILYDRDDPTARDLTQRIVALFSSRPEASPQTKALASAVGGVGDAPPVGEGVVAARLNESLLTGRDWGYIISIPRLSFDPCHSAARLAARAPWIGLPDGDLRAAVLPLVDTRHHAVARRDRFGLVADGFGRILIVGATPKGTAQP